MSKIEYIEVYNMLCIALTEYENSKDNEKFYKDITEIIEYMIQKIFKKEG